jgi:hypothetical protein
MKTKNFVFILSLLLLALVGCGKNVVEPFKYAGSGVDDGVSFILLDAITTPTTSPVVEYTMVKNLKGETDVTLTLLKKADSKNSREGVLCADVKLIDDNCFRVSIPMKVSDYPAKIFLDGKQLTATRILNAAKSTEEEQIPETEDEE